MKRNNLKTVGKLILRSVPSPEVEAKVTRFLVGLMKNTPAARIRSRIRKTPLVLSKKISAQKGELIVRQLEKLGAKASFVPLRPVELKKSGRKTESPRVTEAAVRIVPPPQAARKKRLRYLAAGLLMMASLAFLAIRVHEALIRPTPPELVFRPIDHAPAAFQQATPEDPGRVFDLRHRLRADRRLLDAFAVLAQRFPSLHGLGESGMLRLGTVQTNARQCLLPLMAGEEKIDELRLPLPLTFPDAVNGLDRWHRMLASYFKKRPGSSAAGAAASPQREVTAVASASGPIGILEALQSVQRSWNRSGPDCGLIQAASRGYALLLTMLHPDQIGAADGLFPFALSLTAACQAGEGGSRQIDRALLARAMGYGPYPVGLDTSGTAPAQDRLLAAFLREDTGALSSMGRGKDALAEYLLMRVHRDRLENRSADQVARRLLEKNPYHFSALADVSFAGDISSAKHASVVLPVFLFLKLEAGPLPAGGIIGDWTFSLDWFSEGASDADLSIARFESMLAGKISRASGTDFGYLLDAEQAATVWRSLYLNAMYLRYRLLSDRWKKPQMAENLARLLARSSPGHPLILAMLARSAQQLGRTEEALAHLEKLLADPRTPSALAAWIYSGIASEPEMISYWPRVFDRLDGRPAQLAFSGASLFRLMSLDLAEKYTATALQLNSRFFEGYARMAKITGSDRALSEALEAFPGQLALRLSAAGYYAAGDRGEAKKTALELYRQIHRRQPANLQVTKRIYELLIDLNRAPQAALFVESRLKSESAGSGEVPELRLMLARAYLALDEPQKSLDTIAAELGAFDSRALLIAALANEAMGNLPRARELVRLAVLRGGKEPEMLLPAAAFFWRRGDDGQAADYISVLRKNGVKPLDYAEDFVGALANANLKRLREAIRELVQSGARFEEIHRIAVYYARMKKDAIAQDVLGLCPVDTAVNEMEKTVSRFQIISAGQSRLQALQFLADTVPPQKGNLLGRLLFERGMFDAILAEFIRPEAHPVGLQEHVWLYRLTAWLATGKESRSMGTFLEEHYRTPYEPAGEPDHPLQRTEAVYHSAGRYLMGKISAESLLASSLQADHRAIFAYFIGFSHRLNGDPVEATKWYQICRHTRESRLLEYRWASRELARWKSEGTKNRQRLWHHPFGQSVPVGFSGAGRRDDSAAF